MGFIWEHGRRQRRGARGWAAASKPSTLPPGCPPGKKNDGDKVPSGHFIMPIMPKCELSNVIFAKNTAICEFFFAFLNIKKQAHL